MKKSFLHKLFGLLTIMMLFSFSKTPVSIALDINSSEAQVQYAVKKLEELKLSNLVRFSNSNPDYTIHITLDSMNLKLEAYKIISRNKKRDFNKNQSFFFVSKYRHTHNRMFLFQGDR